MSLRIEDVSWLWLLGALLPAGAIALYSFVAMSRLRCWSAIVARGLVIALLAAALAGATSVRRVDEASLAVAVDVSGSVRAFVARAAVQADGDGESASETRPVLEAVPLILRRVLLAQRGDMGADDTYTMIAFDATARAATGVERVLGERSNVDLDLSPSRAEGTDLAAAIRSAAGSIPPDSKGRILLISDGLARGSTDGAARALQAAEVAFASGGVPIDVVPLEYSGVREVVLERLDAPTRVASNREPVGLSVTLTSVGATPVAGRLTLTQEGQVVPLPPDAERVVLTPGRNVLTLRVPLSPGRLHRFEASFTADDAASDMVLSNNRAVAFTSSPGGGRVLLVDGADTGLATVAPLLDALRAAGVSVDAVATAGLDGASDLLSLQAYDLVVLVDVPADGLSEASQSNLARYVSDTGGGLLMVGGPPPTANSFGAGGWKGTSIEPLLPVTLDLPDRLVMPSTAVVIVLDSSGSMAFRMMGGTASQQDVANRGAAAAVAALDKQDLVGVIEFNSSSSWVVPLGVNNYPQKTAKDILDISPGGGTNLPPALDMAYQALEPVKAAVKHVIVLSDGQSQGRRRLTAIAEQFAKAPGGAIKISTIAVGDGADTDGLERLARAGGGEYFRVIDPNILPRVFVKAVRVVRTPLVREEVFTPVLGPGATISPATAGVGVLPSLGGLILTQPRLDAQKKNVEGVTYALLTPQGEPVLAHWRVGLGQVGAFTSSPLGSGWAKGWSGTEGSALWLQLVRALSRSGGGGGAGIDMAVTIEGASVKVRVETSGEGTIGPSVAAFGPSGKRLEVPVSLTAPGVYEGSVPTETGDGRAGEGVYVVTVVPAEGGQPLIGGAVKAGAAAEEYRLPVDGSNAEGIDLLRRIAGATGGRVLPLSTLATMDAPTLFDRKVVEPREARTPLWPWLVLCAAVVLLLDIATRRVAWDRWSEGYDTAPSASARSSGAASVLPGLRESDSPLAAAKRRARQRLDG